MEVKILIVEDEILIADYIQEILDEEGFKKVQQANTVNEAITKLNSFQPDIILMDINLAGNSEGIALANNEFKNQNIIFITAQNDKATIEKALQSNPNGYLTKPIKPVDLVTAIKLLLAKNDKKTITIKDGFDLIKINLDEIIFVKSDNNYIDIQTNTKKYSVRKSLEGFLEEVANTNFIRVHRSYVVNSSKIQKKTNTSLCIENHEIPFSKKYDFPF